MTEETTPPAPDAEAIAKAAADAQAAADQAAAEAKAAEAAAKAKPKGKAKPAASADDLRAAITKVEAGNHAHGRDALVAEMVEAGASIEDRGDALHIDWLGVKMQTTAGLPNALIAWCSKARRTVMAMGGV